MKVRCGFVSNSSSSSFCIFGVQVKEEELKKGLLEKGVEESKLGYLDDYSESKDGIFADLRVDVCYGNPNDCSDYLYIGCSWTSVGDEETGGQFKEKVRKEVEELLGEDVAKECGTLTAAWYDG